MAEIATTAPTLATLIVDDGSDGADKPPADRADEHDATYEGMTCRRRWADTRSSSRLPIF